MSERQELAALRARLDGLTIRDEARLGRRLKNLRGAESGQFDDHLGRSAQCDGQGR